MEDEKRRGDAPAHDPENARDHGRRDAHIHQLGREIDELARQGGKTEWMTSAAPGALDEPTTGEKIGDTVAGGSSIRGDAIPDVSDPVRNGEAGPDRRQAGAAEEPVASEDTRASVAHPKPQRGERIPGRDLGGASYGSNEREQTADHLGHSHNDLQGETQDDDGPAGPPSYDGGR